MAVLSAGQGRVRTGAGRVLEKDAYVGGDVCLRVLTVFSRIVEHRGTTNGGLRGARTRS